MSESALAPPARTTYPGTQGRRPTGAALLRSPPRLLPTLFDRLRDDAPSRQTEAVAEYSLTSTQLRDIVQRDLSLLLNTTNASDLLDGERHPAAAGSTINFGVPALAGSYFSSRRWEDVERLIRRAIVDYEPRLIAESVQVKPLAQDQIGEGYNVLLFEIHALIDARPYPLELTVQSAVDLETNRISVERSGSNTPALVKR